MVTALKTDVLAKLEDELYKEYPQFRETNNTLIINGGAVLRFKTIGENGINTGDTVTVIKEE